MAMVKDKKYLVIFVPTEVEKKYLKDSLLAFDGPLNFSYKIVATGYGKVNAAQYCALETQQNCDAVVSCGWCGAKAPHEIGDLVNPSCVIDYSLAKISKEVPSLELPVSKIDTLALEEGNVMLSADMWVSPSSFPLDTPWCDPCSFDMESFAIAQVAADVNIPTIVAKIVADDVQSSESESQYDSAPEYLVNFGPVVYLLNDLSVKL